MGQYFTFHIYSILFHFTYYLVILLCFIIIIRYCYGFSHYSMQQCRYYRPLQFAQLLVLAYAYMTYVTLLQVAYSKRIVSK